jgi:phosphatidylcholine synthase
VSDAAPPGPGTATPVAKILAWSVHGFTAMGCVVGFFALPAISRGELRTAFLCLLGALVIDTVDGTLARAVRVKEVLPSFDGKMLDYVFDFVNFVITPAFILFQGHLVDEPFSTPCVVAVLLVSSYHYGNAKAVTPDYYFVGFPAFWNVVVFYLYILELGPGWNLAVVAVFCVLHVVPIKFLYPSRTRRRQGVNMAVCGVGAATALGVLLLPAPPRWMALASAGCGAYLVVASVAHTVCPGEPRT